MKSSFAPLIAVLALVASLMAVMLSWGTREVVRSQAAAAPPTFTFTPPDSYRPAAPAQSQPGQAPKIREAAFVPPTESQGGGERASEMSPNPFAANDESEEITPQDIQAMIDKLAAAKAAIGTSATPVANLSGPIESPTIVSRSYANSLSGGSTGKYRTWRSGGSVGLSPSAYGNGGCTGKYGFQTFRQPAAQVYPRVIPQSTYRTAVQPVLFPNRPTPFRNVIRRRTRAPSYSSGCPS